MAYKIKAIVRDFLLLNDPYRVKHSVREMYNITMLSENEITTEERQDFTLHCMELEAFLDELGAFNKKMCKKIFKKAIQKEVQPQGSDSLPCPPEKGNG